MKESIKLIYKKEEILFTFLLICLLDVIGNIPVLPLLGITSAAWNQFFLKSLLILVMVQKIKLMKALYKYTVDEKYEHKSNLGRAILHNVTANFAIGILMIPLLGILFLPHFLFGHGSEWFLGSPINRVFTVIAVRLYLYVFCFSEVIASVEEIGWFQNAGESFQFIKNNRTVSKMVLLYLIPETVLQLLVIFVDIPYMASVVLESLEDIFSLIIFSILCQMYYEIRFKSKVSDA